MRKMQLGKTITDNLTRSVDWAATLTVSDIRVGRIYTAAQVVTGEVGVAYNFSRDSGCSEHRFTGQRPLAGKPLAEIVPLLGSEDSLESSVAMAALNAAWAHRITRSSAIIRGDVLERVALREDDNVAMIGYFGPLVKPIGEKVHSLEIADIESEKAPGVLPAEHAVGILKQASVAFITSTALLNGTLGELLEAASHCREVIMLGATTPLVPEAFRDTPVTWLCGVVAREPEKVITTVSEGGGMCYFKKFVDKVNIHV